MDGSTADALSIALVPHAVSEAIDAKTGPAPVPRATFGSPQQALGVE